MSADFETDPGLQQETRSVCIHAGQPRAHRPLNAPLYLSSQWEAGSLDQLAELFAADPDRGFYTRFGHPTVRTAEEKIAGLEGAEDALLFGSGMGAISTALYAVLEGGDHVVAHRAIFGQTIRLLEHMSRAYGVDVDFVDATDPDNVRDVLRPSTRLVYLETPSNPLIDIIDIEAVSHVARGGDALVFTDSTFAGPMLQKPITLGADLSLQSASKSMGGHADLIAGSAAGSARLLEQIREMRTLNGPSLAPHACWLLLRGLQTLPLRVRKQSDSARRLAELVGSHPAVSELRYPHHESHPGSEVAKRQMSLGGGMMSLAFHEGLPATRRFVQGLRWIPIASSLGGVQTTLEVPEQLDFASDELGERASAFEMPPGLIRLSVGVEAYEDLEAEILSGLEAVESRERTEGAAP